MHNLTDVANLNIIYTEKTDHFSSVSENMTQSMAKIDELDNIKTCVAYLESITMNSVTILLNYNH